MAGGIPALKQWIVNLDQDLVQVPFPDGFRCAGHEFRGLSRAPWPSGACAADQVAGVMSETYQGGNASFAPPEYMQQLRRWCDRHRALLIFDEVQAGFGRTGTYWGFEHYGVVPDLVCCGKGISSGLPLSAVIGRPEIMDLYPAGLDDLDPHRQPDLRGRGAGQPRGDPKTRGWSRTPACWARFCSRVAAAAAAVPGRIGAVHGKGLVASLHMVKPGGIEPDAEAGRAIVRRCVEKGLLMFAPVGYGGASVKISPPLVITEEPLRESLAVLEEAMRGGPGMRCRMNPVTNWTCWWSAAA